MNNKKYLILSALAALVILSSLVCISIQESSDSDATLSNSSDGLSYRILNDSNVSVSSAHSGVENVVIPDTVVIDGKTYNVTEISRYGFDSDSALVSVDVPESVVKIGDYAFSNCPSLTTINLPNGINSLGDYTFSKCTSLTNVILPAGLTEIEQYVFAHCSSLTSVTISENIASIGINSFRECTSLTEIIVDENNQYFSSLDGVIYNKDTTELCLWPSAKGSVAIPYGVTSIAPNAFRYCASIVSITFPDSMVKIGDYAFLNCDSLISVILPDSVTEVGAHVFQSCDSLTSFTFSKNMTSVPDYIFYMCPSLKSVDIPEGVTYVGIQAFYRCSSLESIILPASVTEIETHAFSGCSSLTSLIIPEGVVELRRNIFSGCTSLASVEIPDSVESIARLAFKDCTSLTSITISENVSSIGDGMLSGCTSLTEIIVDENNQYYCLFDGVLYNKDKTKLIVCPATKSSIEVPGSITSIASYAFHSCAFLESIALPENVTEIGQYAFRNCTSLISIFIPNVSVLENYVFAGCKSLVQITLSDNLTKIGNYAFQNCRSVTSMAIPDSVTEIDESAFYGCKSLVEISVSENNPNYSTYDGALYNKDQTELLDCPEGKVTIRIPDTMNSIDNSANPSTSSLLEFIVSENNPNYSTYDGALYNKDLTELLECPGGKTSIKIPSSVKAIDAYFVSEYLDEIIVDENNQYFSSLDGVLYNKDKTELLACPATKESLIVPETVTSVDSLAFLVCESISTIYFTGSMPLSYVVYGNSNVELLYPGDAEDKELWISHGEEYRKTVTPYYNVKFYNGNEIADTQMIRSGECAESIIIPSGDTFFAYWKMDDGSRYNFTEKVTDHVNLYAEFSNVPHHTISMNIESNGSVTPFGEFSIAEDESQEFMILPDEGYVVDNVLVNGDKITVKNNKFIVSNVTDDTTISITFKEQESSPAEGIDKSTLYLIVIAVIFVVAIGLCLMYFSKQ